MKKLLLGDEAIAQGAIDAGLSGVYGYGGCTRYVVYGQEGTGVYETCGTERLCRSIC